MKSQTLALVSPCERGWTLRAGMSSVLWSEKMKTWVTKGFKAGIDSAAYMAWGNLWLLRSWSREPQLDRAPLSDQQPSWSWGWLLGCKFNTGYNTLGNIGIPRIIAVRQYTIAREQDNKGTRYLGEREWGTGGPELGGHCWGSPPLYTWERCQAHILIWEVKSSGS